MTDAYAVGLYPVALDFGAIGERVAASGVGALLPPGSTSTDINAAIMSEIARAGQWPATVEIGEDCDDILADYYGLAPLGAAPAPVPAAPRLPRRRNRS